ncbi:MAG: glycosyltransferase family 2 protein, partial [bacterium]
VSLLIPAYNEQHVIRDKILNSLNLEYPKDRLQIVVISDGSTDKTNEIVRTYSNEGVWLHEYPSNRGKICALNQSIPRVTGDILIFSDAGSMLKFDAVKELAQNFADRSVGGVSGVYKVLEKGKSTLGNEEDFYWKYETFIKLKENRIGCTLGAHGSLYAIRKSLYSYPDNGTVNDDYVIPMGVIKQGYRTIYEPKAVAYEEAEQMKGFSRRLRIAVGNFQQLSVIKFLFKPLRELLLFQFFSHKVLRLLVPFFLLFIFGANFFLHATVYQVILTLQILFYGAAIFGWIFQKTKTVEIPLVKLPYYFFMINTSYLIGLFKFFRYKGKVSW